MMRIPKISFRSFALSSVVVGASLASFNLTEAAQPSVAKVHFERAGGHGSAVAVSKDTFLTARHVVEGKEDIRITVEGQETRKATVIWVGVRPKEEGDLALLKVEKGVYEPVSVRCDDPKPGDIVYTWGYPLDMGLTRTAGTVAKVTSDYLIATTLIAPGSSGGPLFDARGSLVGINVAIPGYNSGGFPIMLAYTIAVGPKAICETLVK